MEIFAILRSAEAPSEGRDFARVNTHMYECMAPICARILLVYSYTYTCVYYLCIAHIMCVLYIWGTAHTFMDIIIIVTNEAAPFLSVKS